MGQIGYSANEKENSFTVASLQAPKSVTLLPPASSTLHMYPSPHRPLFDCVHFYLCTRVHSLLNLSPTNTRTQERAVLRESLQGDSHDSVIGLPPLHNCFLHVRHCALDSSENTGKIGYRCD